MLTVEMLRQSSALQGLTDTQFSAIAEMSQNDENAVIGTKIGTLHGQYDTDIFDITGIKKKDGEKSYDYAKRILNDYKAKADSAKTVQAQLTATQAQVVDLQAQLEKNTSDETLRQQLKDAKAQVTQLQSQLQSKVTEFETKQAEFDKAIKDTHVDYAFQAATSGLKFKTGITEPIQKTLLNAAKAEVLAKGTPDFVEDSKGGKKLVLRGIDGNILNNPKNNLNPYTLQELVMETSLKDVIDTGRKQTGGGTGGFNNDSHSGEVFDISGARTQVEADKAITAHLLASGLTRDSVEFSNRLTEIRAENNVANLPIR